MKTKICTYCNEEKELKNFSKNYQTKKDNTPKGDGLRANCKKCENKRRQKSYRNNIITRLMMNSKSRAKKTGIEHTITYDDIQIPDKCPLLNVKFIIGKKGDYQYTPTIDRIDSTKGYIPGNVQVICMLANKMKNNATKEECLTFAHNIIKFYNDIV